jgi:autotransporter-associated beta strand protein
MELADGFLERISQGGGDLLELPDGLRIDATKARVERDAKGVVRIYGNFTSPEPGRLFFQRQDFEGVAGRMVGHVLFDREDAPAWKVLPEGEGGAPVLKQVPVDEVLCMGLPPQNMPQDHPGSGGVPNPPYQAVIPLQSLPGATGVVYLDFDGEKGPFPGWWDHDAVHSGFNNDTIRDIWIRVAEDFLPFNLNVTTDRKIYDAAPQGQRIHCIVSSTYGGGGVAYVGSFNWGGDPICWANSYTGDGAVTVITHEVGHTLNLWHHGINDSEYYWGHGSGVTSWAPIMGVGYGINLKHWSKGDYLGATKPWQDDLSVITTQNNGVAYRADDIGDTLATAAYLNVASGGTVTNQQGIIGSTGEVDAFRFKTSGGAVSLNLKTTDFSPNLDILAELVDAASGTVLVSNNPVNDIIAAISTTVPAGEYLLKITGTGMGSPADLSGYANYGSLGSYRVDGTVAGAETFQGFSIAENSAAASSVGTIQPVSLTGTLSYAITGGNAGGAFSINSATGALIVANPAALNFESLSTRFDDPADIELFVTISNGGSSEVIRSLVTVTNVNEAPTLGGGNSLTIIENTRAGVQLATVTGSDPDRYDFPTYSFVSGNEAGFFAIDAGTGRVSIANPPVVAGDTTYNLVVQALDNSGLSAPSTVTVSVTVRNVPSTFTGSPGGLYRTFFHNIGGATVADLTNSPAFPNSPDLETFHTSMDGGGYGDNFGSTLRGYLIPPTSGTYQFWVSSDDASQLILGSNATQVSSPVIASISTWTGQYAWDEQPSGASAPITLVAGQPYYIELRHKEGGGGDHAAVAWSGPGISRQVIPGLYLAPFDQNYAPRPSGTLSMGDLSPVGTLVGRVSVSDVNAEDTFSDYAITGGAGANLFAIDPLTGDVTVAVTGQFNAATTPFYDLTISAKDNGTPALTGSGTLRINVQTADMVWNNSAGTGLWSGSAANWSGFAWIAGRNGTIANSSNPETITLQGALTADLIRIGNGTNNANVTLAGAAGSSLAAATLNIQGQPDNHLGVNPTTTFTDLALTVSGDLTVGRINAVIGGNSIITANRIGGALGGIANADWGQLTIQGNANVTATAGIVGNSTAWGLNLNGGTLTTPGIDYGPHTYLISSNLNFNGTLVKASADNANFITATGGYDFLPTIQSGGARIDTNGFAIGIGATLSGSGPLTKSGAGTLTLAAGNSYTGATTVDAGTLVQQSTSASTSNTVAAGAVLEINTGGTLSGPTTSYSGAGTLRKSGSGTANWPATTATFALGSGSLIDVQAGTFTGGSHGNENWVANLSDLNVASGAVFNTVEANVRVNRITGSGTIGTGYNGAGYQNLSIGVDNGSSTFDGTLANTDNNASWLGNLVKLGSGTITLSGSASHSGSTTVSAGKLIISGAVSGTSSVSVASGAELEVSGTLATTGNLTITGTLVLTGAPQLSAGGTITNNGTIINAAPGYTLPANLVNNGTIYNLPSAPIGLTVTPGNAEVALSWSAVSGASGYVVKQSVFSGGPYTTIATPAGTSHTATGLTNGTTYYFVVSATNPAGEGSVSSEVSATPQSALPVPLLATDLGNVGLAGSVVFNSGTFTQQAAGAGITGTTDACHFIYQTGTGDCSVTVRVQSMTNTGSGAKVGVMIRESLAANARAAGVWVSPSSGILFTRRTTAGGTTAVSSSTGKAAPYWVRITRTGSTFRAFYSSNGTSWTQFGNNRTISMASTTYIGVATTSGSTATLCTGVMTNLTATP